LNTQKARAKVPGLIPLRFYADKWIGEGGSILKRFYIKCRAGGLEYFDILKENKEGFWVKVTRKKDGNEKVIEEFMTRSLFDICLKTGYIYELEKPVSSVA
jgi:hypothetical protein